MAAVRDGKTPPPPPMWYLYHKWRRVMNVTQEEAETISANIMMRDLDIIELEERYKPTSLEGK